MTVITVDAKPLDQQLPQATCGDLVLTWSERVPATTPMLLNPPSRPSTSQIRLVSEKAGELWKLLKLL
jgi:hypothetical protein